MYELLRNELHMALPLTSGPIFYPEPAGVSHGYNTGWVCALVWVLGQEAFYCLGDFNNSQFVDEIGRGAASDLADHVVSCGSKWLDIGGDSPGWDRALLSAFAKHSIGDVRTESQYVCRYGEPKWREASGRSSAIPFDRAIFSGDLGNRDFWEKKVLERWRSVADFLATGLGYCIVENGQIASGCFSGWVSNKVHAVTVETLPEFRRKGFARATAARLL